MKTTVIIPSYNGAHKILNIIQALEKQTYQDFETIIMIDGSTDDTENILNNYQHSLSSLSIINQDNQGRAKVRNNGAKIAQGDLLIFFDDDMIPIPNCVEKHIEFHKTTINSFMTGGLGEDKKKCLTDIQHYKAYLSEFWVSDLKQTHTPLTKENLFLTAANFSTPKALFNSINGFDERLNDAEDWDLAVRAFKQNTPIYYYHEAFAWHDDFITCQSYIKRQKEYEQYHKKLIELKPELYKDFNARQSPQPSGLKKIIYTFFKHNFWIWTIDSFNWLKPLPKKVRHKVYDLIIHSHLS